MADTKATAAPAIVPGRLRNWVQMTIQTRQAQRLVQGRRGADGKPPIIGLYRYGAMMRVIWSGAAKDDPYADWRLLQTEQALIESKDEVGHLRQTIAHDLARASALQVGRAHSLEPARIELTFSNPYGYMGAWLLADMDELVLTTLTARHVGLLPRDASERLLNEAGRAVRRAFAAAQGYRFLAVTRQDVDQGNRKAERARQLMGTLPQAVLDGSLRPEHAPAIDGPSRSHTNDDRVADTVDPADVADPAETETPDSRDIEDNGSLSGPAHEI